MSTVRGGGDSVKRVMATASGATRPGCCASPACRLAALVLIYVLFLVLGSAVFSAIEGPEEADRVRELRELRQRFLVNHPCVAG